MANAHRRTINYKPRMTDYEALAALPKEIADALRYAVTEWDSYNILLQYRRAKKTWKGWPSDLVKHWVDVIKREDIKFCKAGFEKAKGRREKLPSTVETCNVMPLYPKQMR